MSEDEGTLASCQTCSPMESSFPRPDRFPGKNRLSSLCCEGWRVWQEKNNWILCLLSLFLYYLVQQRGHLQINVLCMLFLANHRSAEWLMQLVSLYWRLRPGILLWEPFNWLLFHSGVRVRTGTSLVVQWLRFCLPKQRVRVQSLVGELTAHVPLGQKPKSKPEAML